MSVSRLASYVQFLCFFTPLWEECGDLNYAVGRKDSGTLPLPLLPISWPHPPYTFPPPSDNPLRFLSTSISLPLSISLLNYPLIAIIPFLCSSPSDFSFFFFIFASRESSFACQRMIWTSPVSCYCLWSPSIELVGKATFSDSSYAIDK